MIKNIAPLVFAVLLSGCADADDAFTAQRMTLQSEECRERAVQLRPANQTTGEWSVNARQADFDRDYRACMVEKGFNLAATGS